MLLADYAEYVKAQERVEQLFKVSEIILGNFESNSARRIKPNGRRNVF